MSIQILFLTCENIKKERTKNSTKCKLNFKLINAFHIEMMVKHHFVEYIRKYKHYSWGLLFGCSNNRMKERETSVIRDKNYTLTSFITSKTGCMISEKESSNLYFLRISAHIEEYI